MERREFFKRTAMLSAMAGFGSIIIPEKSRAAATAAGIKIAMCNEMYTGWSLERQFAYMAENGYDGAELAPYSITAEFGHGDPDTYDLKSLGGVTAYKKIGEIARKAGIQVAGLHCILTRTEGYHLTSPDPEVQKRTAEYLSELTRFCGQSGGSYMVLGSPKQRKLLPGVSMLDAYNYAARTLELVCPVLEKEGVVIALEPLAPNENEFIQTGRDALFLIEKMGKPKEIMIHLDCKAMFASEKETIPNVLRDAALHPYMKTFHANDANLQGPGFGKLDFGPIIAALKKSGFQGWIGVEPLDFSPTPERLTTESIKTLKKYL